MVVNYRGCACLSWSYCNEAHSQSAGAGIPLTTKQFYSAGWTEDIRMATIYLSHKYPKAPLLGIGFSLGANVMVRFVAEEGEGCRLTSACVIGNVSIRKTGFRIQTDC